MDNNGNIHILYLVQWKQEGEEEHMPVWVDSFEMSVDTQRGQVQPSLTYTIQREGMLEVVPQVEAFDFIGQKTFTEAQYAELIEKEKQETINSA